MAEVGGFVQQYNDLIAEGEKARVRHYPYSGPGPSPVLPEALVSQSLKAESSLSDFLAAVRSSCEEHAARKGYLEDSGNVAGEVSKLLGISRDHAIGEILYKLLEFRKSPRKVIAVKIAGWAWRLWLEAKE